MASARSRYRKHHTTISITICSEPSWISTQITRDKMYDKRLCNQVLPLFKFIEMFEKRYHRPVSVSELYKLRDLVEIVRSST